MPGCRCPSNASYTFRIGAQFITRGSTKPQADFRDAWPFVSILHDIGYLFEGSLLPLSTESRNVQMSIGSEIARDYFHHRFWVDCGFDSVQDRQLLRTLSGVSEPDFSDVTMTGIADTLRSLGDLEHIRNAIVFELTASKVTRPHTFNVAYSLPGDAFDLWEAHYTYYGFESMAKRIVGLRRTFETLMREGIGTTGIRVLDHGVCSGLLLLLYATFYFRLHFGLGNDVPVDPFAAKVWKRFRSSDRLAGGAYEAVWWWSGVVWATAATAIHNVQQEEVVQKQEGFSPLGMEEDALAYLGILVDCIQEWDRYTVSRESVVGGYLPLQGADVSLRTDGGRVCLGFSDVYRRERIRRALNQALDNWELCLDLN